MTVLTKAQISAAEKAAPISFSEMMEKAGLAAAYAAFDLAPMGRFAVFCGSGNNGGDGFVAARELRAMGAEAVCFVFSDNFSELAREKKELEQICDMLKNRERYQKLGAKLPQGILIDGVPGIGKTLLATSFLKDSGLKGYIVRRSKKNGDFITHLEEIFEEAKKNAPSIILLDDMDKFATDEKDNEPFITVQTCIDSVKDSEVFVIATTNKSRSLPESLLRAGRFDRKITMSVPRGEDSLKIINYYMQQKKFPKDINRDDIAKMLEGSSCAAFETILNEAAVIAGFEQKERIEMEHIVRAYVKENGFETVDNESSDPDEEERVAYHEAGHILMLDIINEGTVGFACVKSDERGFVKRCKELKRRPYEILVSLSGKAAAELKYGWVASGTRSDLSRAVHFLESGYEGSAIGGLAFLEKGSGRESETLKGQREAIVGARLEEYLFKAKEIIASNMEYLEGLAKALLEKKVLLNSEIKAIRDSVTIKKVDIA